MDDTEIKAEFAEDEEKIFKRGDKVNYCCREKDGWKSINNTFVWATLHHGISRYVIQHRDGFPKEHFIQDYLQGRFPDGFEAVHSSQLKDGLKYIWAYPNELELVERKKK